MAVNKKHPDYSEYIEKCKALAEEHSKKFKEIDFKPMMMDDVREYNLYKEYTAAFKALKKEYHYLFTEYNSP